MLCKDGAVECRDAIVEESNQKINYSKFYIPHNLDNRSSSEGLQYVIQQISTISSAEAFILTNEVDTVIDEIKKQIESGIWKESDISTRVSYYSGKVVEAIEGAIGGENVALLDQAMHAMPKNVNVGNTSVPFRAIASLFVTIMRFAPNGVLKFTEGAYDNSNSLSCVEDNLQEINRFISKIEEIAKEKQDLSDKLIVTHHKMKSKVVERMNDGKFINKQFVKDMYKAFYITILTVYMEMKVTYYTMI